MIEVEIIHCFFFFFSFLMWYERQMKFKIMQIFFSKFISSNTLLKKSNNIYDLLELGVPTYRPLTIINRMVTNLLS